MFVHRDAQEITLHNDLQGRIVYGACSWWHNTSNIMKLNRITELNWSMFSTVDKVRRIYRSITKTHKWIWLLKQIISESALYVVVCIFKHLIYNVIKKFYNFCRSYRESHEKIRMFYRIWVVIAKNEFHCFMCVFKCLNPICLHEKN